MSTPAINPHRVSSDRNRLYLPSPKPIEAEFGVRHTPSKRVFDHTRLREFPTPALGTAVGRPAVSQGARAG
jgi:hypothetical protein